MEEEYFCGNKITEIMDRKFYDIPFLLPSEDSDFACKDGELGEAENVMIEAEGSKNCLYPEEIFKNAGAPVPEIEFAIARDILEGWHLTPDDFPKKTLLATEPSMEYWNKLTAQLLVEFNSEASFQNKFISPFFVMGAWKSVSGGYFSFSKPALLIPNSSVPLIATDGAIDSKELEFKIAAAIGSLYFRMNAPEELRDWVGKIAYLEVLVSSPLQKYDSYKAFLPSKHVTSDSYCETLDLSTGKITKEKICNIILNTAWRAATYGFAIDEIKRDYEIADLKFHPFARIPLSEVDMAKDWVSGSGGSDIVKIVNGLESSLSYSEISKTYKGNAKKTRIIGKGELATVVTRPIKLMGAGTFKKMRRVYLRGNFNPSNITVSVTGSRDMLKWWSLSKRKGGTAVSFPAVPLRFYRVEICGLLSVGETLEGVSIQ